MSFNVPIQFVKPILELLKKGDVGRLSYDKTYYSIDEDNLLKFAASEQLGEVKKLASKAMDEKVNGAAAVYRSFKELEKRAITAAQLKQSKEGTFDASKVEVFTMKDLVPALRQAIMETSEKRWVYVKIKDYLFIPVYIDDIEYHPPSRGCDPFVTIEAIAVCGREDPSFCTRNFNLYPHVLGSSSYSLSREFDDASDDEDSEGDESETKIVKKKQKRGSGATLDAVIKRSGFFLATDVNEKEYAKSYAAYASVSDKCGLQYVPVDSSVMGMQVDEDEENRWWNRSSITSLTIDGIPSKVVLDDIDVERYGNGFEHATGFSIKKNEHLENVGNFWGIKNPVLPTLPVVRVFDLQTSNHLFVAADSIVPYAYDETMWEKLILPEDDMDFIQILLSSTTVNISDIIRGKARGIIVVGSGGPGLGKTLTAEAASEAFKKPFYSVQCSQLGIDPEELEKNLLKALARAARWEAILLLDEADVYVRRRGDDIQQNAIVGVFLRVLEYYRGILFMTTNLGNDIDDAILSRATAHLHYETPSSQLVPKLWAVLSKQLTVDFTEDDTLKLSNHFGRLPGRSIRNLIKLTKYYAVSKKKKPNFDMVVKVSRYLNVKNLANKDSAV